METLLHQRHILRTLLITSQAYFKDLQSITNLN